MKVLLIGCCGSGKSSFINTIKSIFAQQGKYINFRPTGNTKKCLTQCISPLEILKSKTLEFHDSFGIEYSDDFSKEKNFENSNYSTCLPFILNG